MFFMETELRVSVCVSGEAAYFVSPIALSSIGLERVSF